MRKEGDTRTPRDEKLEVAPDSAREGESETRHARVVTNISRDSAGLLK